MLGQIIAALLMVVSIFLVACGGGGGGAVSESGNAPVEKDSGSDGNGGSSGGGEAGSGNEGSVGKDEGSDSENTGGSNFSVNSNAIPDGGTVPVKYTCDNTNGVGVSPDMSWDNPPADTRSFAILVYDESATDPSDPNNQVPFYHWVVLNIPTNIMSVDEGYKPPAGSNITVYPNSFTPLGLQGTMYIGPCPPKGDPAHTYKFCVAALNVDNINTNNYQNRLAVYDAVNKATIEKACISAQYRR